jgi:hypothetical protein
VTDRSPCLKCCRYTIYPALLKTCYLQLPRNISQLLRVCVQQRIPAFSRPLSAPAAALLRKDTIIYCNRSLPRFNSFCILQVPDSWKYRIVSSCISPYCQTRSFVVPYYILLYRQTLIVLATIMLYIILMNKHRFVLLFAFYCVRSTCFKSLLGTLPTKCLLFAHARE